MTEKNGIIKQAVRTPFMPVDGIQPTAVRLDSIEVIPLAGRNTSEENFVIASLPLAKTHCSPAKLHFTAVADLHGSTGEPGSPIRYAR